MRWLAVLAFAIGCKYPDPGFDIPADDQPGEDAAVDGVDMDLGPRCPMFTMADNKVELPGIQVAGISVVEDESFAIAWLYNDTLGYTLPPLGANYAMTNLPNPVLGAHVLGDGSALYLLDGQTFEVGRSTYDGGPSAWLAVAVSGIPDNTIPGRPTDNDDLMAFTESTRQFGYEWERVGGGWMPKTAYTQGDLGFNSAAQLFSMNLSPDGAYLVISAGGTNHPYGIYWRARGPGGTFAEADGAYGGLLVEGTFDQPHVTLRCSHLFARNTATGYIERFDLHP